MESEQRESADELREQLIRDGLLERESARLEPLMGGVSSDIFLARDSRHTMVVKRALAQLKVEAEWSAPVERYRDDFAYLDCLRGIDPEAAPRLHHLGEGYFTMEYLEGFSTLKTLLFAGEVPPAVAARCGVILGRMHAATNDAAESLDRMGKFDALRIDPYFRSLLPLYPELKPAIQKEVDSLLSTRACLIHGDFSPKNILVSGEKVVIVDAETCTRGDPAFDVAFFFSHLLLKGVWAAPGSLKIPLLCEWFLAAYRSTAGAIFDSGVSQRTARLIPLLLLARLDGKSPVEYLSDDAKRSWVRDRARSFISRPVPLADFLSIWFAEQERRLQ